jgi:hypothetical protein
MYDILTTKANKMRLIKNFISIHVSSNELSFLSAIIPKWNTIQIVFNSLNTSYRACWKWNLTEITYG